MAAPRSIRTARDDARARALGYESYYDFRLHDYGQVPPDVAPPPRGKRQLLRGHRGETKAFRSFIRAGDLILCDLRAVDRNKRTGAYRLIGKHVIVGPFERRRRDRFFELRDLTRAELEELIEFERQVPVEFSPSPSMDQQRLVYY